MSMFTFAPTSPETLAELKAKYRASVDAPLDGMWEAFTSMADHYFLLEDGALAGYCAVNGEHKMLQFFTLSSTDSATAFTQAIEQLKVSGAIVSTAEPAFLGHCQHNQTQITDHAIMYHMADGALSSDARFPEGAAFRLLTNADLNTAVDFAVETLGADAGWLKSYFGGLIERRELFGLFAGATLIATGECRPSHTQFGFADVGMIVSTNHRSKGIATNMLRQLIRESRAQGLKPICSTEHNNIAAQKAITHAGFTAYHRILDIAF